MGWDLKIGEIQQRYITEQDIWQLFNKVYSSNSKNTTTYKYGLIKTLIENLYEVDDYLCLTFDQIFYSFTKVYWNLIIHHQLKQMKQGSAIERVMHTLQSTYRIPNTYNFDQLQSSIQLQFINQVKKQGKRYVFGALYGDTDGAFYGFNIKEEYFQLNKPVYQFMKKHQRVLIDLTNYHFARMLEKLNGIPSSYLVMEKVENITKRTTLEQYYQLLTQYDRQQCFYCGRELTGKRSGVHVDHVIPWSFVQSDSLWNLVLACQTCNLSKSASLPVESYIEELQERNCSFVTIAELRERKDFINYKEEKIRDLYHYTYLNGYGKLWRPSV